MRWYTKIFGQTWRPWELQMWVQENQCFGRVPCLHLSLANMIIVWVFVIWCYGSFSIATHPKFLSPADLFSREDMPKNRPHHLMAETVVYFLYELSIANNSNDGDIRVWQKFVASLYRWSFNILYIYIYTNIYNIIYIYYIWYYI